MFKIVTHIFKKVIILEWIRFKLKKALLNVNLCLKTIINKRPIENSSWDIFGTFIKTKAYNPRKSPFKIYFKS